MLVLPAGVRHRVLRSEPDRPDGHHGDSRRPRRAADAFERCVLAPSSASLALLPDGTLSTQATRPTTSRCCRTRRSSRREARRACRTCCSSPRQDSRASSSSSSPSLSRPFLTRSPCRHLPPHGSREVIVILGSLTTCDPTNIHQTIVDTEKERCVPLSLPSTSPNIL